MSFAIVAGCTGKVRFGSWSMAETAAGRKRKRDPQGTPRAYRCHHCAGFHVGISDLQWQNGGAKEKRARLFKARAKEGES